MNKKNIIEIRQTFLDFFSLKDHQIVSGSSLLPEEDSSLLFTNSGMNQFKNMFLGLDHPANRRVVTSQRCVRVGGKHNDLENVGYTGHHLTFFEMLGNFSFGDYFKEDAICFAWELLTSSHWFGLSKNKLFVTVYENDKVSENIWHHKIGVKSERIIRVGDKYIDGVCFSDNFWQMGDIGPCGPCSEIFYDFSENSIEKKSSGYGKYIKRSCGNDRYLEIWNLVFMEFNRQSNGTLLSLPMSSVDTGMGLERIASVLQSVNSTYDIDVFYCLMTGIIKVIGVYDFKNHSFRVIADHIRTCVFLIMDGVLPSNEGQGYVLRRIIRRAIRHGKILGVRGIFFYKLVSPLITSMGYLYTQLVEHRKNIEHVLFNEEKKFSVALEKGLEILNQELSNIGIGNVLTGERLFDLYSTYGFPLQFTKNICLKNHVVVDEIGFDRAMLVHKKLSQQSNKFFFDASRLLVMDHRTDFVGYENLFCMAKVVFLLKDNCLSKSLFKGDLGIVILDKTPFYGESGGQVGDGGVLKTEGVCFEVLKTHRYGQVFAHCGKVIFGVLQVGDYVVAKVDSRHRKSISLNHSATHLLHEALSNILGKHVIQKGSFINDQYLRFDFSHNMSMSLDQICLIENIVNQQIRNNSLISTSLLPLETALDKGAKMIFGKKYDQIVRVVSINDFSLELCGGTHAERTGDIGFFVIFNESGISTGVRRIEARCGVESLSFFHEQRQVIHKIGNYIKNNRSTVLNKVKMLCSRLNILEKELTIYRERKIVEESKRLVKKSRFIVDDVKLIIHQVHNFDVKMLRNVVSNIIVSLSSGIVIIFFIDDVNVLHIVIGVTENVIHYVNAVDIVKYLNDKIGGNGGGRSGFAQSGGGNIKLLFNIIDEMLLDMFLIKKLERYDQS